MSSASGDRKRILVIDDEDTGEVFAMILEDEYEVRLARNGVHALRILDDGYVPDLVISDLIMPKMDGFELFPILQARLPGVPILVVSASLEKHMSIDILDKEFTPESLMRVVRENLPT